jgi:hypothetical protein
MPTREANPSAAKLRRDARHLGGKLWGKAFEESRSSAPPPGRCIRLINGIMDNTLHLSIACGRSVIDVKVNLPLFDESSIRETTPSRRAGAVDDFASRNSGEPADLEKAIESIAPP